MTSEEIAEQVAVYLKSGGVVEQLPPCAVSDGRAIDYIEYRHVSEGATPVRLFEGMYDDFR